MDLLALAAETVALSGLFLGAIGILTPRATPTRTGTGPDCGGEQRKPLDQPPVMPAPDKPTSPVIDPDEPEPDPDLDAELASLTGSTR